MPALYVTVRIPGFDNGRALEAEWEAALLTGAVVEQAGTSAALDSDIGYVQVDGQLPDGTTVSGFDPGGVGYIARGQQFAGATDSDAAITNTADAVAATYGVTIDSVKVFHVLGAAPAVIVTTDDFAKLASEYLAFRDDLFGSTPRYQGYYLEIRAPDETPYLRVWASFVTGTGHIWVDPSFDSTFGLNASSHTP